MDISVKDYMSMQPNYPKVADSDKYYLQMTLRLAEAFDRTGLFANIDESTRRNVVLAVIGYYQDVVSDCGIWRSFITIHKQFYGSPLPFYTPDDNYCESELNRDDIRFIIWYVLECHSTEYGLQSPFNADILELATLFFRILDEEYLKAPNPMEYIMAMDVELDNLGQAQTIFELSSWLFWNSYLMRHAARGAIEEAHTEAREIIARHAKPADAAPKLSDLNDRVMLSNPTGPLALTVGEWIKAIVDGVLPEPTPQSHSGQRHSIFRQLRCSRSISERRYAMGTMRRRAFASSAPCRQLRGVWHSRQGHSHSTKCGSIHQAPRQLRLRCSTRSFGGLSDAHHSWCLPHRLAKARIQQRALERFALALRPRRQYSE